MQLFLAKEYRPEFVDPTRIYLDSILALDEKFDIHGMMHVTGGAYTKLKDLLHNARNMLLRWKSKNNKTTKILARQIRKVQKRSKKKNTGTKRTTMIDKY